MSERSLEDPNQTNVWEITREGALCAGEFPIRVWVVEYVAFTGNNVIATRPFTGPPDLVWALVDASRITRLRNGITVEFWNNAASAWYRPENVVLAVQPRLNVC